MFRVSEQSGDATEKVEADHSPDAMKMVEAAPLKGEMSEGEARALRQILRLSEEVSDLRAQLAAIEAKEAAIEAEAEELHERLREMGKRNRERPKVG